MSDATYNADETRGREKPIVWLHGRVETPPFSLQGRLLAGGVLRRVQRGQRLGLPHSRPMPVIGPRCHELRLHDEGRKWRIFYFVGTRVIVVLAIVAKKSTRTPQGVIEGCRRRLSIYLLSHQGGDTP